MKTLFLSCLTISIFGGLKAQVFQLATGTITSTISDSRSVNFLDLNNDGWEDIYISNGLSTGQLDLFYLNDGSGQFTAVTNMDAVEASNPADGASFADYNNDGHIDGMISSWHDAEDLLYLNNGNASLDYNPDAGIVSGSYAETAAFGDFDNDGWLDLYITNSGGDKKNFLYKNLQNGKFERITDHILVNDTKLSRGAIWEDFNGDGHLDLFVVNEENTANDLFWGQGDGLFEKLANGDIVSSTKSSITSSWGDIDNDGDLDLFVGNAGYFATQKNQLYLNQGNSFELLTDGPVVSTDNCTYGSCFGDYDNDGDLDLLVANGFCNQTLANALYENQGDGSFVDVSNILAANLDYCSFGAAWGDANNDGFLDLMIANCKNNNADTEKENTLLINQGNENNWLKIKLIGIESNRNAIGARIRIKATFNGTSVWQLRTVSAQSGYAGQNSMIAHFGIGAATEVDSLVINWPAGGEQVLEGIAMNQQLIIEEDIPNNITESVRNKNVQLNIFPNPITVKDTSIQLEVKTSKTIQKGKLVLYDMQGKVFWSKTIELERDTTKVNIPLNSTDRLPGVYQLVFEFDKEKITKTIVVQ